MAFSLDRKIEAYSRAWAEETAILLKESLERALKEGQPLRRSGQEAALSFYDNVIVKDGKATVQILATGDYWINIEDGRGAGEKRPPSDKLGKKWQGKNAINAKQILAEITANYKKKKGLSSTKRKLSKIPKELSQTEASKRLSHIFASSISKKGIPPKPFVDRVLTPERLNILTDTLSDIIGEDIAAELNFNNEFRNIKITI